MSVDLQPASPMRVGSTGSTPLRVGVMGWPVAHSRSPLIHNHWIAAHGLNAHYELLPTPLDALAGAVHALPTQGFLGVNLTIPHKVRVLEFLDEIDDTAKAMGAANVVQVLPNGRLRGRNTDAFGYITNLTQTAPNWQASTGPAVVLGAGGAARAVAYALAQAGVPGLRIVNRSLANAQELAGMIAQRFANTHCTAHAWEERNAPALLGNCALLVNTTELGMQGKAGLGFDVNALPAACTVSDIVYAPLVTPLLHAAAARGLATSDGLGMLLYQAQAAFKGWFGVEPTVSAALRQAVERDLTA